MLTATLRVYCCALVISLPLGLMPSSLSAATLFVAPDGNDAWSGNLVPIALKANAAGNLRRWGGGTKPDGSDGFQIYENGGDTACHAFHTLAAL